MSKTWTAFLVVGLTLAAQAQLPDAPSSTAANTHKKVVQQGVGPYLGSLDAAGSYEPFTVHQKFGFAAMNSFGPVVYPEVALIAGINQASNQQPSWGQGGEGFAKRYGAAFADQAINTMLSQAVLTSIFKQDPRYFRLGHGGFGKRVGYSISRLWITRSDSGRNTFNASAILGAGATAGISRIYYPDVDRTAGQAMYVWGTQLATDVGWNALYEFWPDIRHAVFRK